MDLLNVLAQIIVVIAALIWVLLQFAWKTLIFAWEIVRDYTPLLIKRVIKLSQKVSIYLKKLTLWVAEKGLPWFQSTFNEVYTKWLPKLVQPTSRPIQKAVEPEIQVSSLGMIHSTVPQAVPTVVVPLAQLMQPVSTKTVSPLLSRVPDLFAKPVIAQPAFFDPLPEIKGNAISALLSGISSLFIFVGTVLIKLFGFSVYLSGFILRFVIYLSAMAFSIVLAVMGKLVGLRQHAPSTQDTYRFIASLVPRVSFSDVVSRFKREDQPKTELVQTFTLEAPNEPTKSSSKLVSRISFLGMVSTAVLLLGLVFPDIALKVLPYKTEPIQSAVDASVLGGSFDDGNLYSSVKLPERNEYLPEGNWLNIPKIGVMTEINEETMENHEEALKKGVWRVSDFADPTQGKEYPTILVAHKYGYLKWTNDYRRKNSFYNLNKLEIGDTFEVIWDKRKFVYEVYAGDEGKDITDYNADVVLYTCKHLNSPIRIFRYARRVEY